MEDSLRYVYPIEQFYEDCRDDFKLEALTESLKSPLPITVPDVHRPAFLLTGFMEFFLHERIQLLGETETLYLRSLSQPQQRDSLHRLFSKPLCCIIVT